MYSRAWYGFHDFLRLPHVECFPALGPGRVFSLTWHRLRVSPRVLIGSLVFSLSAGFYFTGDGALRDKDGEYRITGRMDDVINVSGKRLGTAEIEDAMVTSQGFFYNLIP